MHIIVFYAEGMGGGLRGGAGDGWETTIKISHNHDSGINSIIDLLILLGSICLTIFIFFPVSFYLNTIHSVSRHNVTCRIPTNSNLKPCTTGNDWPLRRFFKAIFRSEMVTADRKRVVTGSETFYR